MGRVVTLIEDDGTEEIIYQPAMPRGRYWVDTSTVGLTGTWDTGDLGPMSNTQFKSISAWRQVRQIADEDLDAIGSVYLIRHQPHFDENTQISQELQFTGSALNDSLFFSTGLYYFREKTPRNDLILSAGIKQYEVFSGYIFTNGFETSLERLETDNEALAWFGQVDFSLTPQIELTAGLRFTREERWSRYSKATIDALSIATGPPRGSTPGESSQAGGRFAMRTTEPGVAPISDWLFGTNDYIVQASGIYGHETVRVSGFVTDRMEGDEETFTNSAWTPMVSLKYQASDRLLEALSLDQAMAYLTYSEGFHSGGVTAGAIDYDVPQYVENDPAVTGIPCQSSRPDPCNLVTYLPQTGDGYGTADPITFEPEYVNNYEVGLKTTGFDRRLQANVAVFYMDYTDMQVTSIASRAGIPVPYVENVGKSVIKGVEAEFVVMPSPEWRVLLNSSYTDADIKEWNATVVNVDLDSGGETGEVSVLVRDDEPLPRVPEWQAFLLTDYGIQFRDGSVLTPSIAARYMSEIFHGFDRGSFLYGKDQVTSDPATFIDARIGYVSSDERLEVAIWGKNLTNIEDYLVGGIPLADVNGGVGRVYANPRTFGLTMTYNFGI